MANGNHSGSGGSTNPNTCTYSNFSIAAAICATNHLCDLLGALFLADLRSVAGAGTVGGGIGFSRVPGVLLAFRPLFFAVVGVAGFPVRFFSSGLPVPPPSFPSSPVSTSGISLSPAHPSNISTVI